MLSEVLVELEEGIALPAYLALPPKPDGFVLFAHGSGSSRHSSRNHYVARELNAGNLATLLLDLLTPQEGAVDRVTGHLRFDIGLLTQRVIGATRWARKQPALQPLPLGLFGASTGAAAALIAAAALPSEIDAVVSRGGRPDLAGEHLSAVRAPTLLIVGSDDTAVIELNRQAAAQLLSPHELVLVPGATHLFEEPGTLEEVARLSRAWFVRYLAKAAAH